MSAPRSSPPGSGPLTRSEMIADAAIALLAERGLRALTHRAVDEAAGLPQGSTSNHARTRAALIEAAVRRLAVRESQVIALDEMPTGKDTAELADGLALAVHRYLTRDPSLLLARYELALEIARRPGLREMYVHTGTSAFREPLVAMLRRAGSSEPERHTLSLVAWCDGMLFSCTAGSYADEVPSYEELRAGVRELLHGMLAPSAAQPGS
ncbi:TetR family transcriptional regulator [Streptomyces abyssalis]|uniref:TetR family transcriptional regulator n=1 Tax=Streptomyces abyssalis TaxID=933944 RepID=A0A1E7JVE5_9ACTN|nr:TetR/AcrR family transcriptional regulator [Streptomyces abyssalis]OEU94448.1 TetR family transcriptional regulator [Streptomyces abyssalis]OEU95828.1 TetR family transcriptional regulator [Streptomyces abyssalis]OEV27196.1 TetR family transcriptional regulator [Streptomyces nanshensis]